MTVGEPSDSIIAKMLYFAEELVGELGELAIQEENNTLSQHQNLGLGKPKVRKDYVDRLYVSLYRADMDEIRKDTTSPDHINSTRLTTRINEDFGEHYDESHPSIGKTEVKNNDLKNYSEKFRESNLRVKSNFKTISNSSAFLSSTFGKDITVSVVIAEVTQTMIDEEPESLFSELPSE